MTSLTPSLRPPLPLALDAMPALVRHLQHCHAARSRWFGAAALAERAHGLVGPRFITTVSVAALLLALSVGWV